MAILRYVRHDPLFTKLDFRAQRNPFAQRPNPLHSADRHTRRDQQVALRVGAASTIGHGYVRRPWWVRVAWPGPRVRGAGPTGGDGPGRPERGAGAARRGRGGKDGPV